MGNRSEQMGSKKSGWGPGGLSQQSWREIIRGFTCPGKGWERKAGAKGETAVCGFRGAALEDPTVADNW